MIRNFKTLGVAIVAVLAMSAVVASAAHATNGTSTTGTGGTVNYTATQVAGGIHTFTLPGGRTLTCATATFSGSIGHGATETVASPNYQTCHAVVGGSTLPATVTVNSCTYRFTIGTLSGLGTFWNGSVHLECAAGVGVEIHLYENHTKHTEGKTLCKYKVDPQTVSGIEFSNTAGGTVMVDANEAPVTLTKLTGTVGNCGEAESVSKYNGETTATGAGGVSISIH